MAEILGKDLDKWDDSLTARQPFSIKESKVSGPQFLTGSDFVRSARINPEWKMPVAIPAQAKSSTNLTAVEQATIVGGESAVDSLINILPGLGNLGAQYAIELVEGKKKEEGLGEKLLKGTEIGGLYDSFAKVLGMSIIGADAIANRKEIQERVKTYDDAVELLNNRDYPLSKYARRILAETTDQVETRKILRELYNQSRGIDSEKWYNEAGAIIGAMIPTIAIARGAGSTARAFGATRIGAANVAQNVAKGFIGTQMAGEYAEQTAAEYLQKTGDKTFANFTAKDASGLGAIAYGAIGAQIEFIGGVEPIMAGALRKVGLRSGLVTAALKIGGQEAGEEFLQSLTETLMRKIDKTTDKTWKEGLQEALNGAVWGLFIGGTLGTGAFQANRRNLIKGIKASIPNINDLQATRIADAMIDSTAETSSQDPGLRRNLRQKVEMMYELSDIDNKENAIDAITDLEYGLIAMDSAERGIAIEDNPIFRGDVNELGWFREGIPAERRTEIQGYIAELNDLKDQLKKLNEAEQKDWDKIDELESKLDKFNAYVLDKLSDLAREDASAVRRILRDTEEKFVRNEKIRKGVVEPVVFQELPDKDFDKNIEAGKSYDYENNGNKFRYTNAGINHQIELLDKDGNTLSIISIGKDTRGVESIETFGEENWRKGRGSAVLVEAERLFGDFWVRPELKPWAQGFWKKKNKYTRRDTQGRYWKEKTSNVMFQEQFDLANENARLDDIYPAYEGETITINGKQRTVYNSNGERIAKSAEALRNFYKWFGDSKVVDEQGRPLVVYHGTNAEFNTFDKRYSLLNTNMAELGAGFYFDSETSNAESYGDNIMPVYLRITKPFTGTKQQFNSVAKSLDIKINTKNISDIDDMIDIIYDIGEKRFSDTIKKLGYDGTNITTQYIVFDSTQIKSTDNRGTYSEKTGNIYLQNRVSGAAPSTYRGAYIPQYRFIQRANKMDASTLSHELAHDWFEVNFARYRSGEATKDFMRAWGALEKALGVSEDARIAPRKASETFARAYEAWIINNEDWAKLINIEEKDKDAIVKLMQDYQSNLRDIYQDITNSYFKQTWGKLGELKPELKAWFDRAVNITDLDVLVERGEMTELEATTEKLNRAIDTVIETTEDEETKQTLKEVRTLNNTNRYEVEGGNKNSIQQRLSNLAREIDENNMLSKGQNYDTRRDMMQVAEAADNFVKTRLDDALAIINGEMAETEGLYKEDLYTALERLAIETGDLGLIDELKNSEVANRLAKELGQRVAGFRNFKQSTDLDVASALKSLDNKFNKALDNKKAKKQFDEALKMLDESLKQQDKLADKELDKTLKQLECQ